MSAMTGIIARRELAAYFATPLAYVFVLIFLMLGGVFTFYIGGFFERGQADLAPFFNFHPWLYLFLVPAIAMRLWSEERKSGTIELLLTLPVTRWQAVLGKFLAAWAFLAIALALTFPIWLTVNYLGANVPGEEFAAQQQRWGADLVCVSFTPPRGPADAVRLVRSLAQGYDPARPYHLALGGGALDGKVVDPPYRPFRSFAVLGSLVELAAWLDGRRDSAALSEGAATDPSAAESSLAEHGYTTSRRST